MQLYFHVRKAFVISTVVVYLQKINVIAWISKSYTVGWKLQKLITNLTKKKEILKVKGYISLSDDVFDAVMKKTEIFLKWSF